MEEKENLNLLDEGNKIVQILLNITYRNQNYVHIPEKIFDTRIAQIVNVFALQDAKIKQLESKIKELEKPKTVVETPSPPVPETPLPEPKE